MTEQSSYKLKDWKPGEVLERVDFNGLSLYTDMLFEWIKNKIPPEAAVCTINLSITFDVARKPAEYRSYTLNVEKEGEKPVGSVTVVGEVKKESS